MDLSLLAGATSRGLNDALQGANTGMLQGEQIRHQRAGEDLAQQHLQMQQQQLTNHLAQQAFQQGLLRANQDIARGHLGLQQQQADTQARWHDSQIRLANEMQPYLQREHEARTNFYGARGDYYDQKDPNLVGGRGALGMGTEAERYKNGTASRMGFGSYLDAPKPVRDQIDAEYTRSKPFGPERSQRLNDLHVRSAELTRQMNVLLANPPMSGSERMTRDIAMSKMQRYNSAMNRINQDRIAQIAPDPRDVAEAEQNIAGVEQDLVNLQNIVSARGFQQANPGVVPTPLTAAPRGPVGPALSPVDAFKKQWGLK